MKNDFEDINELVNNLAAQMKDFAGDLKGTRNDLLIPGAGIKGEDGRPIGCQGLSRI